MKETMRLHPRRFPIKLNDGDLRRLHIFCTVTRCGGFAAAESALQMGLPSISRSIKDLEIRLGVRLCKRGRVGFELTEPERRVFEASLQLTTDLKTFESKMRGIHDGVTGTLTLGLIDTLITDGNLPLPQLLRRYRLRYPLVEAQELIARYVGSAPVLDHSRLRLSDQELSAVCAPNPSIRAATEARFQFSDYMERRFTQMVTS